MRVLVLGATGFIGGHLSRRLKAIGYEVVEFGSRSIPGQDLRQPVEFPPGPFDRVYNCVGEARMYYCEEHPAESLLSNVMTTINAVEAAKRIQPAPRFIHLSSGATHLGPVYGEHKRLSEYHVYRVYSRALCLRPGSAYGPGAKKGPVLEAWRSVRDGTPLEFHRPCDPVTICYVGDIASAMLGEELLSPTMAISDIIERLRRPVPHDAIDEKLFTVKQ